MGTHYIKHSCGHEVKHLLSVAEERSGKVEWLETVPCRDCWAAQKRAAAQAAAAEIVKEYGKDLPALTGSEKQVKWAEEIRAKFVKAWKELLAQRGEAPEFVKKFVQGVLAPTEARFFIERLRGIETPVDLIKFLERKLEDDGEQGEALFEWLHL